VKVFKEPVILKRGCDVDLVGTMIELPTACVVAEQTRRERRSALRVLQLSFGTKDLDADDRLASAATRLRPVISWLSTTTTRRRRTFSRRPGLATIVDLATAWEA